MSINIISAKMGQQLKKSDKVLKSDKVSKSDELFLFVQKAIEITNKFKSVFDDVIVLGLNSSNYYIISLKYFGLAKAFKLNELCKKNKVTYFCMYNTKKNTFDFYLYVKNKI